MNSLLKKKLSTLIITSTLYTSFSYCMNNDNKETKPFHVRLTPGISAGECKYLQKRLPIARAALEKMLNNTLEDKPVPTIAFVASGGGYRAMLDTIGSLRGAEKIGLLDTACYIAALSGSTWALAPWITLGLTLKQLKRYIQLCIEKPLLEFTKEEKKLIKTMIKQKKQNKQPYTLGTIYGALIANRLLDQLGIEKQKQTLSQQTKQLKQARYPYPLYAAIDGDADVNTNRSWYEFTPHEVSNLHTQTHIPTKSYGKKFNGGKTTDNAPEYTLGENMGTWGSAFAANINEILEAAADKHPFLKYIEPLITNSIGNERILPFWTEARNYMYNTEDNLAKYIKLVDAGLATNLPYPLVSGKNPQRKADILIFLDASAGTLGKEFKECADYARENNLPFPEINDEDINKQTISIFKDPLNPSSPLVIYLPRISDADLWQHHKNNPQFKKYNLDNFDFEKETNGGFCDTPHFQYSIEHSSQVMNEAEFNIRVNKDSIAEAIAWKINNMPHV